MTIEPVISDRDEKKLSFEGLAKKLDSYEDANDFAALISDFEDLEILQLNGNTLGVEASKCLKEALAKKPTLKKLVWHDIYTGRLRAEVPESLRLLFEGVMCAGARLEEVNLSDNAFGPAGVEGIKDVLASSSCFTLHTLLLNNNGLGTFGAAALSQALISGYNNSLEQSSEEPFQLKKFIAGRNRLENPGCTDMARVFNMMRSLEHLEIPQNGIQADGIIALSEALCYNTRLTVLNLNDNIITERGAVPLIESLKHLQVLEVLNLGDSLIRTPGALKIGEIAEESWPKLRILNIAHCEIKSEGGLSVARALKNKRTLQSLDMDGNCFGAAAVEEIIQIFQSSSCHGNEVLKSMDEDDEDNAQEAADSSRAESECVTIDENTLKAFVQSPTEEQLAMLGPKYVEVVLDHISPLLDDPPALTNFFLDVSTGCQGSERCVDLLNNVLLEATEKHNLNIIRFCDVILEQCGLIKSEDKKFKPRKNLAGPLKVLSHVVRQAYFTQASRTILITFLNRPVDVLMEFPSERAKLLSVLYTG